MGEKKGKENGNHFPSFSLTLAYDILGFKLFFSFSFSFSFLFLFLFFFFFFPPYVLPCFLASDMRYHSRNARDDARPSPGEEGKQKREAEEGSKRGK